MLAGAVPQATVPVSTPHSSTHYTFTIVLSSPGAKCPRSSSHRARTYLFRYTPLLFKRDAPSRHTQRILTSGPPSCRRKRTPSAYASDGSYRGHLRVRAAEPINSIPCGSTRRGVSQTDGRESAADVPVVRGGVPRHARTGDDYHGHFHALPRLPFSGACNRAGYPFLQATTTSLGASFLRPPESLRVFRSDNPSWSATPFWSVSPQWSIISRRRRPPRSTPFTWPSPLFTQPFGITPQRRRADASPWVTVLSALA